MSFDLRDTLRVCSARKLSVLSMCSLFKCAIFEDLELKKSVEKLLFFIRNYYVEPKISVEFTKWVYLTLLDYSSLKSEYITMHFFQPYTYTWLSFFYKHLFHVLHLSWPSKILQQKFQKIYTGLDRILQNAKSHCNGP